MQIPFFSKKSGEDKIYFGLFLKEDEGIGMVIKMKNSNPELLDDEKFTFSNGWENLTEDVDQLILKLEERTKTHLFETIFFVYSHFIDPKSKEIQKPIFQKIKDLVKKLDLKAIGYIECYEAVVHLIEKKEDLPLTAILLELDKTNLSVFVYKRGELIYSKVLTHTDNIIDDLLTCFQEVGGKFLLPSRIILYNSKDLDEESTQIVTHRWSESIFIQLPRVEIIKEHEIVQGLIEVFVAQIGKGKEASIGIADEVKPKEEVMGFVIGEDASEKEPQPKVINAPSKSIKEHGLVRKMSTHLKNLAGAIPAIPGILTKRLIVIFGILFVVLGIFLNEYFLHKASLTLYLPFETIEKDINISASLNDKNSTEFVLETVTKTKELSEKAPATGKKEIGERARGVVTMHNFDDKEKSFSKDTVLETGNLAFSLDQDVKVASSSVITISGGLVKQPGKTKTNVTAKDIGPGGNITSGKQFTIAGVPSSLYFAMNENAFTGGTKKEIKTVSKDDLAGLETKLIEKAKSQKLDSIDNEESADTKLLGELTKVDLTGLKYDKEVGEEANEVNLKATAKAELLFFRQKKLLDFLAKKLDEETPHGFVLQKDKVSYKVKNAKENKKVVDLSLSASVQAMADVSKKDVIDSVKGKSKESLKEALKARYKVLGFKIDITPKIVLLDKWMPFFSKNITLTISTL